MHSYGATLPQSGFTQGLDGTRLAWAKSHAAFAAGWGNLSGNPYMRFPGPHGSREAAAAADISGALLTSNPTIAAAVEALVVNAIGVGLTPSARLDHVALNITEDEARELEATFNARWAAWAGNPLECDLSGRHTLHGLAAAGFRSYVVNGELLATIDWQHCRGATTRTKVALLDPRQCDRTKSVTDRNGGTWNGVAFDKLGRVRGYWLREIVAGQSYTAPMAAFVPASTAWGRPKVLLLWDLALPCMVRGMSPLVAALTPAHEGAALQEFTLAKALINASFAMTVESDSPADVANGNLNAAGVSGPAAWEQARVDFYTQNKLDPKAGVVNYMPPGDKLKFNESKTPSSTYEAFQGSLKREAAKASGNMVEDVTGDYSKTSFSASRMAQELPHRITLRRRAAILEPFYSAVRAAWMEEQLETGAIALPPGAPAFWEARDAYTACRWNGPGRASPDPKKSAEAAERMLNNHLTTHTDLLAEDGKDFETVMRRLAYEQQVKRNLGLIGMPMEPGVVTTQVRDQVVEPPASEKGK